MSHTKPHQPVAYQIEDANGEFMCLSRTKSTIRGIASKPLYDESALEAERTARIEAQQQLADAQELAAKSGLAHMKAVADAVAEEVAAEREACAKACESSANGFGEETLWAAGYVQGVRDVADGIRARGTPRHNNGEHDAI